MPYCTQSDLEKKIDPEKLIGLTSNTGTLDAAVLTEAIAWADGVIDGYLDQRYTVPLATVTARVRGMSVDLAIWYLHTRRDAPEPSRDTAYKDALDFLERVQDGKATLGEEQSIPADTGSIQANIESSERVFTRDSLGGF